jgi:hypothetical protein
MCIKALPNVLAMYTKLMARLPHQELSQLDGHTSFAKKGTLSPKRTWTFSLR